MAELIKKIVFEVPQSEMGRVYDLTSKYFETALTDFVLKEEMKPSRLVYKKKMNYGVIISGRAAIPTYFITLKETPESTVELEVKMDIGAGCTFSAGDRDKFNKFTDSLESFIGVSLKKEKEQAILTKKIQLGTPVELKEVLFKQMNKYMESKGFSVEESTSPISATFKKGRGQWMSSIWQFRIQEGEDGLSVASEWRFPGITLTETVEREFKKELEDLTQTVNASLKASKDATPSKASTHAHTASCPKCGKSISGDFAMCPFCGQSLKAVCPKCNKQVSPEFAMCPFCGQALKASNTCAKCGKELNPEFAMCPFCGTKR